MLDVGCTIGLGETDVKVDAKLRDPVDNT